MPKISANAVFLLASTAHACTVCHSAGGRSLRAGIFDGHFLATLAEVLSPVSVIVVAIMLARALTTGSFPHPDLHELESPQ